MRLLRHVTRAEESRLFTTAATRSQLTVRASSVRSRHLKRALMRRPRAEMGLKRRTTPPSDSTPCQVSFFYQTVGPVGRAGRRGDHQPLAVWPPSDDTDDKGTAMTQTPKPSPLAFSLMLCCPIFLIAFAIPMWDVRRGAGYTVTGNLLEVFRYSPISFNRLS